MHKTQDANFEIGFRLSTVVDPEERLEEALLWKLMHDFYGERIGLIDGPSKHAIPTFGRELTLSGGGFHNRATNPISGYLPYWNDPAFMKGIKRSFEVVEFEQLGAAIKKLHDDGKDAFIKSTRPKHHIQTIRKGQNVYRELDAMAYSFIDGGPAIMVQEWKPLEFEFRFFIIDREIVTWTPKLETLTPFDHPTIGTYGFRHQDDPSDKRDCGRLIGTYLELLKPLAEETIFPDVSIDVAVALNPHTGVSEAEIVEYNPMQLGQLGLFACDVKALVSKSPTLLTRWTPPATKPVAIEEEYNEPRL